jgi:hypothetical protein
MMKDIREELEAHPGGLDTLLWHIPWKAPDKLVWPPWKAPAERPLRETVLAAPKRGPRVESAMRQIQILRDAGVADQD